MEGVVRLGVTNQPSSYAHNTEFERSISTMAEFLADMLIAFAIFAGATVSGFCGFAFSAIAGAMLLHVLPASTAVPLMMACSVAIQGASLTLLRRTMNWKGCVYRELRPY